MSKRKFKPYTGLINSVVSFAGLSREAQDAAISSALDELNASCVQTVITRMPNGMLFVTNHVLTHYPPH